MNKPSLLAMSLSLVMALVPLSAMATEKTFVINDESHRDVVNFTSDAAVELIKGTTTNIDGTIRYDEGLKFDAAHPYKVNFTVDLPSIDTGIGLRNEHMRENFLETDKYPKAVFKVKTIQTAAKAPLKDGQTVTLNATGDFTLHGVTHTKTIPVQVTYWKESALTHHRFPSGDMIRIRSHFPVKLTDYQIKRPEAVFTKLAESVFVDIDAFGQEQKATK